MRKFTITLSTFLFIFFLSCSNDSEPQEIPDTIAPVVTLSIAGFPNISTGETIVVSNQINISVDAKDEGGISKIEAFINDEKVGEDSTAPYNIIIDISSYASKVGKTAKYKDYNLKVTAIDKAGNASSTQMQINIDNEIPSITDVSLVQGTVISGDTNNVTFNVVENQVLSSVMVYLNDDLLSDITDEVYAINIDASSLSDGENILRIEAKDSAENLGSHSVKFIVDNTGPAMLLESVEDGQIVDEMINLNPQISDEFSDIESVEILYKETSLVLFDNTITDYTLDFDPDLHQVGEGVITLIAKDVLGNTNQLEVNINIIRLLLKITIPDGYFSPDIQLNHEHFVFASKMDGTLIDIAEILFLTREVKLHSLEEFENNEDFTLTFASMGENGVNSFLYSISNLNREHPKNLDLETPTRFVLDAVDLYPIVGLPSSSELYSSGRDYHFTSSEQGDKLLNTFKPRDHEFETDGIYFYTFNPLVDLYTHQFVQKPIPTDFEINVANFSTQNIDQREFTTSPSNFFNGNYKSLMVYGYKEQEDLDNDMFHKLWEYGYGQGISITSFEYPLNTQFYAYSHELTIGNYHSRGVGLPADVVEIPNWSIDYSFQNNIITLQKSGAGHTNGEIYLDGGYDVSSPYQWNIVFDSNKNDEIALPNIPAELQNFNFYNLYQNSELEVKRVGVLKYDNEESYSTYLENIVKNNKSFGKSAPHFESIFAGDSYNIFPSNGYLFNQ